jgi:hypothetical protein
MVYDHGVLHLIVFGECELSFCFVGGYNEELLVSEF